MKMSEALNEINSEGVSDEDFDKLLRGLDESIPFVTILEDIKRLEVRATELEKENNKLKGLLRSHSHANGKVMIEA